MNCAVKEEVGINLGGAPVTLDIFNERKLKLPHVGESYTLSFPPHACWVMPEQSFG